jgi:hypothetical protein
MSEQYAVGAAGGVTQLHEPACGRDAGVADPGRTTLWRTFSRASLELPVEHVLQPGYDYGKELATGLTVVLNGVADLHDR